MSEEKMEQPVDERTEEAAEEKRPAANIGDELQELGHQLTAATKAVLASPEAKEMRAQLQRGMESLEKTVNQLAGQARETKVGQTVESSVNEAAATMKERRVLETVGETIGAALRAVNQALGQAVEKAETHAETTRSAPQQIEVVDPEDTAAADTGDAGDEE
jgi:hypothetical protein